MGKAQPTKSPYDARKENELVEERAPKRQKTVQAPPTWRASSPVQEESPAAKSHVQVPARKPARFIPPTATVITIDSEPDPYPAFPSDVSMPSTPPKVAKARAGRCQLATPVPQPVASHQPPVQTPRIPKGKVPVPSVRALQTPKQRAPPSSPPVSASNRLSNVDFAIQLDKEPPKEQTPLREPEPPPPAAAPAARKPKSLRLSAGVKRGRLLCQAVSQQAPVENAPKAKRRTASHRPSREPSPALNHENDSASHSHVSAIRRKGANTEDVAPKQARVPNPPSVPSPSMREDPEVIHGRMDQQLLMHSSPVQLQVASSPPLVEASKPKPATAKKTASKKAVVSQSPEAIVSRSRSPSPKLVARKVQARRRAVEKPAPVLPHTSELDPQRPALRDMSPTHTETSEAQSRAPKKRSKKQPATTDPTTGASPPPHRNESAPLPPHPLRSNKKGPLMSTTELATLLQQPKNLAKALIDPIENEANVTATGKSPSRNFRRVCSENDAPIPSVSEQWEKRNLPKPRTDTADEAQPSVAVTVTVAEAPKKKGGLSALIKKTDPRQKLKRTQSLQVNTSNDAPQTVVEAECPSPIVDKDVGPWSTEAGDLFDWRPPGRVKE